MKSYFFFFAFVLDVTVGVIDSDSFYCESRTVATQDSQVIAEPKQDDVPPSKNESSPKAIPKSVAPGINDSFLNPDLSPDEFIQRFEIESREVYNSRMHVLRACKIKPGMRIADIGAGTGLYTRLFADKTGPSGWVFGIDIAPRFIEHINSQSVLHQQRNVTAVLCLEDSICLPPESIDLAFICDTYHHFEYPQSTLSSIFQALKPGGRMVVIDFIRIEGKSRPWVLDHVRAGQEVFTAEILEAGFKFVEQIAIPGFEENYFLVFEKETQ